MYLVSLEKKTCFFLLQSDYNISLQKPTLWDEGQKISITA